MLSNVTYILNLYVYTENEFYVMLFLFHLTLRAGIELVYIIVYAYQLQHYRHYFFLIHFIRIQSNLLLMCNNN